jgi:hypothetical protein
MRRAMPEATVLYSVTAAVVAGLVLWVGTVLATSKVAWARPAPPPVPVPEAPLVTDAPAPAPPPEPALPAESPAEPEKTEGS